MYGSFAKGEGDAYSDIEFYLFFADEVFQTIQIDAWVAQVSPVALLLTNEFGTSVAIFENGVRGEFHFEPASRMAQIRDWPAVPNVSSPHATLVLNRTGELAGHLAYWHDKPFKGLEPDSLQTVYDRLLNWLLLGLNVLERGRAGEGFRYAPPHPPSHAVAGAGGGRRGATLAYAVAGARAGPPNAHAFCDLHRWS